jgi:hypothetical protein
MQAARELGACPRYRVDCLAVLQMYQQGFAALAAACQYFADVWLIVQQAWDGRTDVDLAWMPAHTAVADIGVALLSNGVPLTAFDRNGNAAADDLAKAAARAGRVDSDLRSRIAALDERVTQQATWVAHATLLANGCRMDDGVARRDATTTPAALRRPRLGAATLLTQHGTRKRPRAAAPAPRPEQLGGHRLELRGRLTACLVCRRASRHAATFAAQRCRGSAAARWAERAADDADRGIADGGGHRRRLTGSVLWCDDCGAYADRFAIGLASACRSTETRRPPNRIGEWVRGRLRRRLHPRTGELLAAVTFCEPMRDSDADDSVWLDAVAGRPAPAAVQPSAAVLPPPLSARQAALLARLRARAAAADGTQ